MTVILGLYTDTSTNSSYGNRSSTILRVSRSDGLDVFITDEDRRGNDPLPEHTGKARFVAVHDTDGID